MEKVARNYGPKKGVYDVDGLNAVGFRVESPALLIIKLPDSRFLRIMSRSVFLAMFLLALPSLCTLMTASSGDDLSKPNEDSHIDIGFKSLPLVLSDFLDEGLIKKGHNGLMFGPDMHLVEDKNLGFLRDAGIELITGADLHTEKVAAHIVFDFVITTSFGMVQLIDGIVKDNALVILPLSNDPSDGLRLLKSYKIVYLRRFERTVVAMRKMRVADAAKEAFYGTPEEKKAALKGLEGVYLEPPTQVASSRSSAFTSRKIKFLPDLLKDSLDEYPRRIFISDDRSSLDWLYKHYPKRDQVFELYSKDQAGQQELGVSTWLKNKVRCSDFVVMKAEAQVVEEMLRDKTLHLVDELFLQCNNQWQDAGKGNTGKRAYWQCLELYGKVTDEGIAVHQWWNRM